MKQVSLAELQNGAVVELFDDQLRKVLDNIADINTKPDSVRKIKIELAIKPDKTRKVAETKLSVSASLANIKPWESFMFFEKESGTGKISAFEDQPGPELPGINELAETAGREGLHIVTPPQAAAK